MDLQIFWIIALSIATPVAGVVGFAIQIREVKRGRLENEKLQLEIEALRANVVASERRIVQVTTEEVQRFATRDNILYSRRSTKEDVPTLELKTSFKEKVMVVAIVTSLVLLAAYLLYDIYRLVAWLSSKF